MPRPSKSASTASVPQCGSCMFWIDIGIGPMGECHRNAPLPMQGLMQMLGTNTWPHVGDDDWCGEYQASTASSGAPVVITAPSISGTLAHPSLLACTQGTWTNSPLAFAYQWASGGNAIPGATSDEYMTAASDVGLMVTCAVTAENETGSGSSTSNALGPIT